MRLGDNTHQVPCPWKVLHKCLLLLGIEKKTMPWGGAMGTFGLATLPRTECVVCVGRRQPGRILLGASTAHCRGPGESPRPPQQGEVTCWPQITCILDTSSWLAMASCPRAVGGMAHLCVLEGVGGYTFPDLMRSNLSLGCWFPRQRQEEQPSNQAVMLEKKVV